MIEGKVYISTVKAYFDFLITEYGFKLSEEKIRGNAFYDVQYKDKTRIVSVSYENIEEYLQVIIFVLANGELPDYDDKTRTLHLNKLNALVMSRAGKDQINLNNEYFIGFNATNELEKKLLKSAKELRLYLKHINQ